MCVDGIDNETILENVTVMYVDRIDNEKILENVTVIDVCRSYR